MLSLAEVTTRKTTRLMALVAAALLAFAALATQSWGSAGCHNEQFRTGLGANLPDCRAYEQVSPQEKSAGGVDGGLAAATHPGPEQAADNGESVTYESQTAFAGADPQSALLSNQYMSRRTANGWSTTAITPPQELENGKINISPGSVYYSLYQGFGSNLEYGYLVASKPAPVKSAPAGYSMPYLHNNFSGKYALLAETAPPVVAPLPGTCCRGLKTNYQGMTADGSHVIFEANDALVPGAFEGNENLYEWNEGTLELVNVLPNGAVELGRFGMNGWEKFPPELTNNALSRDGKRAFWSTNNGEGTKGQVYMHEITPSGPRTVDISATQKTNGSGPEGHDPGGTGQAQYWAANAEGTLVYLTSPEQLTNEATASYRPLQFVTGTSPAIEGDLYQYNVGTGKLTDLTVDENTGERAGVQGVIGASEDGSYVYFAAKGVLANGAVATSSNDLRAANIYVWHDGEIKFIGTTDAHSQYLFGEDEEWGSAAGEVGARVSPNGKYLAFTSVSQFGSHNTEPATSQACVPKVGEEAILNYLNYFTNNGKRCTQVYVYDAATAELTCASCAPAGLPSTGDSYVPHGIGLEPVPGWQESSDQQRYLSSDGRLFFESSAGLVAGDTNGNEDVYEWEPAGVGGCSGARPCLSLISGGVSARESQFVDANATGSNVFFITFDQLAGSDGDEHQDLYDARVDGGFVAPLAPPCQGEVCRSAVTPAPAIYGAPTSQAFSGVGNPYNEAFAPKSVKKVKGAKSKIETKRRTAALKRCQKMKTISQRKRCKQRVNSKSAKNARTGHGHGKQGNGRGK